MNRARAIVAGHGDFATGIVSAAVQITGRDDVFIPMSNRGLSAVDVTSALGKVLKDTGATVIFTDLPAGSCSMAARRLHRERPELTVIMGVNLATLLDFVFDESDDATAARAAAEKGRAAISVLG